MNDTRAFDTEALPPLDSEAAAAFGEADAGARAGAAAVPPSAPTNEANEVKPHKKRRPWLWVLATVALLGVLAGGAELALRAIIPNVIVNAIRENLGLPKQHPVEVELHGSALLPALSGKVGKVDVTVPDVTVFDNIVTTLQASAESMPFDPTKGEIVGGVASAKIPSSSMGEVVKLATNGLVDEGEVLEGEIKVGRTIKIFGFDVPLSGSLAVSAAQGDLLIQPNSIKAVGFDLSVEQLQKVLGEPASSVLGTHTVCIRDQVPAGIELTDIELTSSPLGGYATITVDLAPDVLSNPKQQEPGTCDAA